MTKKFVSERLKARVVCDFPEPGSAENAFDLLAQVSDSERIQAAIVFFARGDYRLIQDGVALAGIDWRDVLMRGVLAHEGWELELDRELGPPVN